MKTIQLLLSGLFLVRTRGFGQQLNVASTAISESGDRGSLEKMITLSNTKDNRLFDRNQSPHGPQVETETIQSWHEVGFLTSKERRHSKLLQGGVVLWRQVSN